MKTCSLCKQTKPYIDFTKHSQKSDGYNSWCKCCSRAKAKIYNNKPENKQHKADYDKVYNSLHKEQISKSSKLYRETRKIEKAKYDKKYRELKGETRLKQKRDYYNFGNGKVTGNTWRLNNKDKVKANDCNQTIKRQRKIKHTLTSKQLSTWENSQLKICSYCNTDCSSFYHIDHIEPLSKQGTHTIDNLTITCPTCNLSKGSTTLLVWLAKRINN